MSNSFRRLLVLFRAGFIAVVVWGAYMATYRLVLETMELSLPVTVLQVVSEGAWFLGKLVSGSVFYYFARAAHWISGLLGALIAVGVGYVSWSAGVGVAPAGGGLLLRFTFLYFVPFVMGSIACEKILRGHRGQL